MDNMLILHPKCDQNVLSKNSQSTVNRSSQCSQDVITGFQIPLPPVTRIHGLSMVPDLRGRTSRSPMRGSTLRSPITQGPIRTLIPSEPSITSKPGIPQAYAPVQLSDGVEAA